MVNERGVRGNGILLKNFRFFASGGKNLYYHFCIRTILMKKIIFVLALLAMTIGISACNTVEGLGRDVEVAGEKIQNL
tara:strand:+ start:408 stop:641 length:234 start_codon:yes stop_codon:yes gene_type:complete